MLSCMCIRRHPVAHDTFRIKLPIQELVEHMLNQLPDSVWTDPNVTFLDPAFGGGQFILAIERRLKATGHSADNISQRIYGCESLLTRVKYVQNWFKSVCTNLYVRDALTHDWGNMKFDIVVGNPPYQDPTKPNSHNLWCDFVEHAFDLVKPNGHVAFVTPNVGRRSQVLREFQSKHVVWYNGADAKIHFQGVGSTFCAWVIQNSAKHDAPCMVKQQDAQLVPLNIPANIPFWPLHVTPDTLQFIEHMTVGAIKLDVRTDWGYHSQGKKAWFNDTQTKKFKYEFQNTSSSRKWCSQDHEKRMASKVICSKSGYLKPWYDAGTTGVTENSWVVPVRNHTQAKRVISFLESDAVKQFVNLATGGNTLVNDPQIYRMLSFPG
jgi:SAM-dependent methyltransferase